MLSETLIEWHHFDFVVLFDTFLQNSCSEKFEKIPR